MLRRGCLSSVAVLAAAGCGKSGGGAASAPAAVDDAAIAIDAAVAIDAPLDAATAVDAGEPDAGPPALDPEEVKARTGKQAGFTGGAKPEVATEAFMTALATGTLSLASFVDPARAVVLAIRLPGGAETLRPDTIDQLCGKLGIAALTRELAAAARQVDDDVAWWCSNTTRPSCYLRGPGEYAASYAVTFAPDPVRGLRLVSIVETEVGEVASYTEPFLAKAATAVAKARACR
ncbi:MAG: hypothetical protein K8W52_26015 [Deltaproteobacteria bacterium]|nr:hypothetical protein [Deltaproteobacteria bacterium]